MFLILHYSHVGSEIGGIFTEDLAKRFDKCYNDLNEGTTLNSKGTETAKNYILLLSHLFNFGVINFQLIFDLLKKFITSFKEFDIELLLVMIRTCGSHLRSNDPMVLKDIISLVFDRAQSVGINVTKSKYMSKIDSDNKSESKPFSKRIEFMLEVILNLKNNKILNESTQENINRLKKTITTYLTKKKIETVEPIRIGWEDILNPNSKGRWWIIGSAWAAPSEKEQQEKREALKQYERGELDDDITKTAKKHRMNTETSRAIFSILVTSDDYMDAYQKIKQLKLKDKQDRELASVLIYCCQQEKVFNPYYSFLTAHLCRYEYQFSFTLKLKFWDFMTSLQNQQKELPPHKMRNVAQLCAYLVGSQLMPVTIFKNIPLINATPASIFFYRKLFDYLLTEYSNEDLIKIFWEKISLLESNAKTEITQILLGYIMQYIQHKKELDPSKEDKLLQKASLVKKSLKRQKAPLTEYL